MTSHNIPHVLKIGTSQGKLWDCTTDEENHSVSIQHLPDSLLDPHLLPTDKYRQYHTYAQQNGSTNLLITKPPAIFSFFSGVGFLDFGFESRGFTIAHMNEVYAPFLEAYRYARQQLNISPPEYGYYEGNAFDFTEGKKKNYLADLIKDARKTSNIVGFIGGPPCPDFSVGGKNRGREGDNGKLSATYIELVCQQKPDFFLFENVKGLWKTKRHREFYEEIKKRTQEYYVTTECLINALEYGVPQDRERIILLGFRKDLLANITTNHNGGMIFPWKKLARYSIESVFASKWPNTNPFEEDSRLSCLDDIIQELTVEYWFRNNDVQNHPNAEQHFKPRAGLARFASIPEGDDSRKSFKRLHRWRYSPTACYGNNEVHLHPYKTRRISVAEALSIQSLPKTFILPPSMTLTNAFKSIGNGVPYLMSGALAQTILDFLGGFDEQAHSIQHSCSDRTLAQEPGLSIY